MATELSEYQKDILVRTVLGEARGEGMDGMEAVAAVIRNRTNSGQFPNDPAAVALQPSQFSVWNSGAGGGKTDYNKNSDLYRRAEQAVERVFSGQVPDRTNGALYYHTPAVSPNWADEANQYGTTRLGNHIFYNGRPTPPGEIPNQVASLQDTTPPPRVAPNPATISPDLSLMRNPIMSSAARTAQVTPPLPQPRPVSPMDIARAPGTTVATIPTSMRPGQSQIERITPMPSARDIAMAPGQTVATIPTSGIGQPPATRTVPSVPYTLQPTEREIAQAPGTTIATIPTTGTPSASQINSAARRAALTANQSNVERNLPPVPTAIQATAQTAPRAMNIGSRDSVANTALGQRVATQMAPAFNQPSFIPDRLVPNPIVQPSFVPLNQPPIQVVPSPISAPRRVAPIPMAAGMRPLAPARMAPQAMPRMAAQASPLRVTVNGAGSYSAPRPQPMTPIQSLMAQGMSQAQAYNALTQRAPTLEDRVRGSTGLSSSGASAYSISG